MAETTDQAAPTQHPEEMTATIDFQAGGVSLKANARATPAGFVGVALLLFSVAAVVWVVRRDGVRLA